MINFQKYISNWLIYKIERLFNLKINKYTQKHVETFIFVLIVHELAKYIHRKLNVEDFHCKHKGKYRLNVNILK